ncbi:MAG: type II toxin-antitoxin system VapC family toxin [bacterium]|nr:type II toxin-antitoxin system VapC family toxin [bacterium]
MCDFFRALIDSNIRFAEIDSDLIQKTLDMTKQGHEKSGFPTFSDSMYQAIAIREDALFITADKRHYEKTNHLGNIELLGALKL